MKLGSPGVIEHLNMHLKAARSCFGLNKRRNPMYYLLAARPLPGKASLIKTKLQPLITEAKLPQMQSMCCSDPKGLMVVMNPPLPGIW